nr:hypothetical protein [Tanacetum cinerariifolium]
LKEVDKNFITTVLPFSIGIFPVKYLGVPLIAKRLGIKECGCLLDKIKSRTKNWRNMTTIKEINKLLKGFLWNHGESAKGKAKVAWSKIYRPKDQEGLGLKNLQCIPKHSFILWLVIQGKIYTQDKLKEWGNQAERNRRIFKDVMSSSGEVYTQITEIVRNKSLGIKVKNSSAVRIVEIRGKRRGLVTRDLEGYEFEKTCKNDKNLSEIQLEDEKDGELVAVVVKVVHECESFWEESDDFGVDVLHFYTCLTDILGFLEKLECWFEQDIDDEGEEDKEGEGGREV